MELAKRGASVILGCRDLIKGRQAAQLIKTKSKNPNVSVEVLDLASFDSVKEFANRILKQYDSLDFLINNAGKKKVS